MFQSQLFKFCHRQVHTRRMVICTQNYTQLGLARAQTQRGILEFTWKKRLLLTNTRLKGEGQVERAHCIKISLLNKLLQRGTIERFHFHVTYSYTAKFKWLIFRIFVLIKLRCCWPWIFHVTALHEGCTICCHIVVITMWGDAKITSVYHKLAWSHVIMSDWSRVIWTGWHL